MRRQSKLYQSALIHESLERRDLLTTVADVVPAEVAEGEGENALPDFSLVDVNSTSSTFNQSVSPRDYLGEVSAWYFGHSRRERYCRSQYDLLGRRCRKIIQFKLTTEVSLTYSWHEPDRALGMDTSNVQTTDGRDIPWLQDVDADNDGQSRRLAELLGF